MGFTDACSFLPHYLDEVAYPNISSTMLTVAALIVCPPNRAFYVGQIWTARLCSEFRTEGIRACDCVIVEARHHRYAIRDLGTRASNNDFS